MYIIKGESRIAASQSVRFSDLTTAKQEKALYLSSIFNDASACLVSLLDLRGKNSYLSIDSKLKYIKEAPHEVQTYHNFILDSFELGAVYSKEDILAVIAEIRRDLGMPSPASRVKASCEADFTSVFLFDEVYTEREVLPDGKPHYTGFVGYMPTFKLKPQD